MKNIIPAVILILAAQMFPARAHAIAFIDGPGGIVAIASVLGIFGSPDTASSTQNPKVAKSEFSTLNSKLQYVDLLNQSAGGELNTLEILK